MTIKAHSGAKLYAKRRIELSAELFGACNEARKELFCEAKFSSLIELELSSEAKLRMSPQRSYFELAAKLNVSILGFFRRQMLGSLSALLDQWSPSHWFIH